MKSATMQILTYLLMNYSFMYQDGLVHRNYHMKYTGNKTDYFSVTKRTCEMQPFFNKWQLLD